MKMEDDIKRWTAKRKSAPVLDIIQCKTAGVGGDPAVRPLVVGGRAMGQ